MESSKLSPLHSGAFIRRDVHDDLPPFFTRFIMYFRHRTQLYWMPSSAKSEFLSSSFTTQACCRSGLTVHHFERWFASSHDNLPVGFVICLRAVRRSTETLVSLLSSRSYMLSGILSLHFWKKFQFVQGLKKYQRSLHHSRRSFIFNDRQTK